MCQFLGRRDCMESLQKDVADLQCAIADVFTTTGPVRVFSWKFPDKLSCNLDLDLEQYSFMDEEDEFNQHAHLVLLELVIDRLLLLLQASNAYVVKLSSSNRNQRAHQKEFMSIGLVAKDYWRHLLQFANMKTLECNEKPKTEMSTGDESVATTCAHDVSPLSFRYSPDDDDDDDDDTPLSATPSSPSSLKVGTHAVSCQTDESPAAPCNACHEAQSSIRKTGNVLVELLQGEGLPSSLHPLLVATQDTVGPMTPVDVKEWASEQLRDMRRLTKHVQDVRRTFEPLTNKLAALEADREKLRGDMELAQTKLKEDVEKQKSVILQLEEAQATVKGSEQRLSDEYQKLKREYESLKKSYSDLTEEAAIQQDRLQDLERQRNSLQEKLKTLRIKEETCCELQERIHQFESQLCEAELLLEKEKAKYHSACRHHETLQTKQKSFLQRVEALDEECEELQKELGRKEERELHLRNQLQQMSEDNQQLRTQLTSQQDRCSQLQTEKQTLETQLDNFKGSVAELEESVKSFEENERLLVAFPELSPLAHAQPQSTGDVLLDMEQQLQANCIRIGVLQKENATLHATLEKLRETTQQNDVKDTTHQQESSPLQMCSFFPASPPVDQLDCRTPMQRRPCNRQTSRAAWSGYNDRCEKEIGVERVWLSNSGADHVSPARVTSSTPQSISLQTLHFNITSAAARTQTRNTHKTSNFPQSRSLKLRKK
ncbi:coiled-coil domain-containing protein 157 isoform X2 [Syngnathoides biaculeatus]|uniref:coiled-coil domain-containing protein 157 isoform X2 n=1 Tax=Syngnathoides biaculeatus TaxID=300417 RepID=UPI002ADE44D7|nr:coiled-coil domain-containing protein 157 isoform X2 [Syngnathoides biaculeatus]